MIYDGDSFFTLSEPGQAGLIALSLSLGALSIIAVHRLPAGRWWRVPAALGLFWGIVWLSPQLYYAYYRVIIDSLPAQIVIGAPPTPTRIVALLTFSGAAALNAHGLGLLGWAMALVAILTRRR